MISNEKGIVDKENDQFFQDEQIAADVCSMQRRQGIVTLGKVSKETITRQTTLEQDGTNNPPIGVEASSRDMIEPPTMNLINQPASGSLNSVTVKRMSHPTNKSINEISDISKDQNSHITNESDNSRSIPKVLAAMDNRMIVRPTKQHVSRQPPSIQKLAPGKKTNI